jgi:hypothetical protein
MEEMISVKHQKKTEETKKLKIRRVKLISNDVSKKLSTISEITSKKSVMTPKHSE